MAKWTEGYVSDIDYTYGYYSQLNPNNTIVPFLHAGLEAPKFTTACELGFGQGVTINAHAAASNVSWYGTDFNPAHARFAQELADIADSNVHVYDQSFAEFCSRDDLPDFDFIGLHGIWSWVSDENRHVIIDFLRRKLKVGGVLYISYNTLPGWSATAPIRHMLNQHDNMLGKQGENMQKRVQASLSFTKDLINICNPLNQNLPTLSPKIEQMQTLDPNYLAHEYFNADWQPMYFSEVAQWLSPTKTSFACSPNILEDMALGNLTTEQQELLDSVENPLFQQTIKDYMYNTQFRQDYWVKGARHISVAKREKNWHDLRFLLLTNRQDISLDIDSRLGKTQLLPTIYEPIFNLLSDYKIHQMADIEKALTDNMTQSQLFEALTFLYAKGCIVLVQDDQTVKAVQNRCDQLNAYVLQQSLVEPNLKTLTSPLTGGGFNFSQFDLIFLYAYQQEKHKPEQLADVAWQALKRQGKHIIKEGQTLQTEDENLAELTRLATNFIGNALLIAQRLLIVK